MPITDPGWQNTPPFSIEEAQQRGVDVYEVLYTDWGMFSDGSIGDQWPPAGTPSIPASLAGISIGPRSTVDRAWLTYNIQKIYNTASGVIDPTILTSRIRQFSVDSPLLFSQAAAPNTFSFNNAVTGEGWSEINTMNLKGSLIVWPQGQYPRDRTTSITVPSTSPLGGTDFEYYDSQLALTYSPGNVYYDVNGIKRWLGVLTNYPFQDCPIGGWVGPLLHLLLYLKAPVMVPTKRAPLKCAMKVDTSTAGRQPTNERVVAQIATYGRSTVHVMMMADRPCKFRIGAIRVWGNIDATVNAQLQSVPAGALEEPVDVTTVSVAANTPVVMNECAAANLYADFLNLYATADDNSAPIVWFNVSGYD